MTWNCNDGSKMKFNSTKCMVRQLGANNKNFCYKLIAPYLKMTEKQNDLGS